MTKCCAEPNPFTKIRKKVYEVFNVEDADVYHVSSSSTSRHDGQPPGWYYHPPGAEAPTFLSDYGWAHAIRLLEEMRMENAKSGQIDDIVTQMIDELVDKE